MSRRSAPYGVNTDLNPFFVQLVNHNGNKVFIDKTGALKTIPVEHYNVHVGNMFNVIYYNPSVADTASIYILLKNGSKEFHYNSEIECFGNWTIATYRSPVTTNNGAAIPINSHNDEYDPTTDIALYHTPTITSNGTLWYNRYTIGSNTVGAASAKVASSMRQGVERILKPNTDYIVVFTNNSGGVSPLDYRIDGYFVEE